MTDTAQPQAVLMAEWVLPVSSPPIQHGFVAIRQGRIAEVGRIADLPKAQQQVPQPDTILSPGLINTHTHLEQSFPEPLAPQASFTEWLLAVIARNRRESSSDARRQRCRMGALELLRTGTTGVNDIASGRESLEVLDELGLRGVVSLECFHPDADTIDIEPIRQAFETFQVGFERHPRLQAGLSPHSPYNVSPRAWQALLETCRPAWIHTHLAEFGDETAYLQGQPSGLPAMHQAVLGRSFAPQGHARSPVNYMARHRLLNDRTVVAHAVQTDHADRQQLAHARVGVAHCPRSNMALHGQTLRYADWRDGGIALGLGTDGRLSTPDLDLRAEARRMQQIQPIDADQLLCLMTLGGARVLQLDTEAGSLTPGKWADCVLWQSPPGIEGPPEERLLHPEARALQTLIAGECRWQLQEAACPGA